MQDNKPPADAGISRRDELIRALHAVILTHYRDPVLATTTTVDVMQATDALVSTAAFLTAKSKLLAGPTVTRERAEHVRKLFIQRVSELQKEMTHGR